MRIRNLAWNAIKWRFVKKRLGYTNEEMTKFRADPRNEDVLNKAPDFRDKTIIAEVTDSRGCNSQHKVGDKLYFDAAGNLITERCPKRVCIYALNAITPQIFATNELLLAGVNPNEMRFRRAACFDVGLECGGWGRIAMEIKVEGCD